MSAELSFPAYEIGDDTHRRLVAKLRGLPDTMPWDEIDRARHEEQRVQVVTARGLPQETTWKEIREIETQDYRKRRAAGEAAVDEQRVLMAVGLGLGEGASWKLIDHATSRPHLTKRLQLLRLEKLYKVTCEIHELARLLDLPDKRGNNLSPE